MKNPLLLDEADKRGEQHFYRRSSSCRKSFITFFSCDSRNEKEISVNMYHSPLNKFLLPEYIHQKYI